VNNLNRCRDVLLSQEWSTRLLFLAIALLTSALFFWRETYMSRHESIVVAVLLTALAVVLVCVGVRTGLLVRLRVLLFVTVLVFVVDFFLLRWEAKGIEDIGLIGHLSSIVLTPFVYSCSYQSGSLLVDLGNGARSFSPSASLVCLRPFLTFLIGCTILRGCLYRTGQVRAQAWLVACVVLAAALRFAWGAVYFQQTEASISGDHHIALAVFWSPWSLLWALALVAVVSGGKSEGAPRREVGLEGARHRSALVLLLSGGVLSGVSLGWFPPAVSQGHRVLIDDRLGGVWEPAARLLTADRFGDFSTYSFASLVEHLSHYFAVSVNTDRIYDRELLEGYDVLILKTPQVALGLSERRCIQEWVSAGGGLFVIGDHTDLSGMNTYLNQVVSPMGLSFRNDSVRSTGDAGFVRWAGGGIPEHPITAFMDSFGFMTGCSVAMSGGAVPVMTIQRAASKRGDYSQRSNFGIATPEPGDPHGLLVLSGATTWGRGRVVAFADSTVFSSFAYFSDSHADYCLRAVTWLSQESLPITGAPFRWAAVVCSLLGVVYLSGAGSGFILISMCVFMGGAFAAFASCLSASSIEFSVPPRAVEAVDVGMVAQGGNVLLPPVLGDQPGSPELNLMTFFITPQRLGQEPRLISRTPDALNDLEFLVVLNPDADTDADVPGNAWFASVTDFVETGGVLIVLSPRAHVGHDHEQSDLYLRGVPLRPQSSGVQGLDLYAGRLGSGTIYHVVGSEQLSLLGMGHCMSYPNAEQRAVHDLVYRLFNEKSLGRSVRERRTFLPSLESK
jgi:hypothetical protein